MGGISLFLHQRHRLHLWVGGLILLLVTSAHAGPEERPETPRDPSQPPREDPSKDPRVLQQRPTLDQVNKLLQEYRAKIVKSNREVEPFLGIIEPSGSPAEELAVFKRATEVNPQAIGIAAKEQQKWLAAPAGSPIDDTPMMNQLSQLSTQNGLKKNYADLYREIRDAGVPKATDETAAPPSLLGGSPHLVSEPRPTIDPKDAAGEFAKRAGAAQPYFARGAEMLGALFPSDQNNDTKKPPSKNDVAGNNGGGGGGGGFPGAGGPPGGGSSGGGSSGGGSSGGGGKPNIPDIKPLADIPNSLGNFLGLGKKEEQAGFGDLGKVNQSLPDANGSAKNGKVGSGDLTRIPQQIPQDIPRYDPSVGGAFGNPAYAAYAAGKAGNLISGGGGGSPGSPITAGNAPQPPPTGPKRGAGGGGGAGAQGAGGGGGDGDVPSPSPAFSGTESPYNFDRPGGGQGAPFGGGGSSATSGGPGAKESKSKADKNDLKTSAAMEQVFVRPPRDPFTGRNWLFSYFGLLSGCREGQKRMACNAVRAVLALMLKPLKEPSAMIAQREALTKKLQEDQLKDLEKPEKSPTPGIERAAGRDLVVARPLSDEETPKPSRAPASLSPEEAAKLIQKASPPLQ